MSRKYSAAEKAAMVEEYMAVPHGDKLAWAAEQGVKVDTLGRWRRAYMFGDLDRDLAPRDTSGMDPHTSARIIRLQQQLDAERQARRAERQRHDDEIARMQAVTDALGKAIGLLHGRAGEREPTDES